MAFTVPSKHLTYSKKYVLARTGAIEAPEGMLTGKVESKLEHQNVLGQRAGLN